MSAFKRELERSELQNARPDLRDVDEAKQLAYVERRLAEFQTWWSTHQNDAVHFPTPTPVPPPDSPTAPPTP